MGWLVQSKFGSRHAEAPKTLCDGGTKRRRGSRSEQHHHHHHHHLQQQSTRRRSEQQQQQQQQCWGDTKGLHRHSFRQSDRRVLDYTDPQCLSSGVVQVCKTPKSRGGTHVRDATLKPSIEEFAYILHKCRKERNLAQALQLHDTYMCQSGFKAHASLGNKLVSLLVEVGSMCHAQKVFDRLVCREDRAWNSLIIGYVKCGESGQALNLYQEMQKDASLQINAYAFVALLKACSVLKDLERGCELHAVVARRGLLEKDVFVGCTLVDMYAKCGSLAKAQEVFDKLPVRDVVLWNALIAGYAEHGHGEKALYYFEQIQQEGISRNVVTFVSSLKACGSIGATAKGQEIHAEIAKKGLERDLLIGNTLVDMYAKCGLLAIAQEVFDKLPVRDVVSWNALIAGYTEQIRGEEALYCFEQMQHEGISQSAVTSVCILKACGILGAIDKGREIHADIVKKGLQRELLIGNTLVDMYVKCGSLVTAQEAFDELLVRDVVSWTALIAGYVEHGHDEEALYLVEQMQYEGISPNSFTLVCSLKACGSIGDGRKGRKVHAEIFRKGLEGERLVGNALVDMYSKHGLLVEAQVMFDELPVREVVSWTALIAGYVEHGHGEEALNCFEQMQGEGISPDAVALIFSLKACVSIGATDKGREIHAEIVRKGLLEKDVFFGSTLVDLYAKSGLLAEGQEVFDKLPLQDVASWSALMGGYAEHGGGDEVLDCFKQMQDKGIFLTAVTFVCSLKACGSIGATVRGQEIHAEIARKGLEKELLVGSSLVDMYAKCGSLADAQVVFDKLPVRDVISWTTLMAAYAEHARSEEAIDCFEQMRQSSISLNAVAFVCSLKACGSIRATVKGQEIHAEIVRKGLERELLVSNTLVDMYAKCGLLATAQEVFNRLPVRDVISWNALLAGYVEWGQEEEALNRVEQMQREGIYPNAITFVCTLRACVSIGATVKGRKMHSEIARKGLERELLVGNILIDMYAKCGSLAEAQQAFDKLSVRDMISWNALMAGYAQLGESENVFHIFDRMIGESIKPNLVTFMSVLNACSHAGLVNKGQMYFEAMSNDYGFIPTLEHYTCMVDLLGRAGHIDKAVAMIRKMPLHPDIVVWHTVLGACRKWGNVELGRHAFENAVRLDKKGVAAYLCMFNIYAEAAMQEEANKVEVMRIENQAWKKPGHACGVVQPSLVEDKRRFQKENTFYKARIHKKCVMQLQ